MNHERIDELGQAITKNCQSLLGHLHSPESVVLPFEYEDKKYEAVVRSVAVEVGENLLVPCAYFGPEMDCAFCTGTVYGGNPHSVKYNGDAYHAFCLCLKLAKLVCVEQEE
jgi:hypothetical protein